MRATFVALLAISVLAGCNRPWMQFGYGPGGTRSTTDTQINVVNVKAMVPAWSASLGGAVTSSPAVNDGVLFVGSGNGKLYAFDSSGLNGCGGSPTTCTPLWTAATGNAISSSPAAVGGSVFVGSDDGHLYAFDAAGAQGCSGSPKTCQPRWSALIGSAVRSSPTVAGGVVYVGADDGKLYAFDAAGFQGCSGTPSVCSPLWSATTGGAVRSTPAVADGSVYVGSGDGHLYAFDASGSQRCAGTPKVCLPLWSGATSGAITGSPAVSAGTVVVGSTDRSVYAFDAAGAANCSGVPAACSPLWTARTGGSVSSSPAIADGRVLIGSDDGYLHSFSLAGDGCTGQPRQCSAAWIGKTGGAISSSPALVGGVAFVGSGDGRLVAFDAAGDLGCTTASQPVCTPLWSATTGLPVASSPAVANGTVYVGSNDAKLRAFKPTGSTTPVPPTVPAPRVIAGTDEVTLRWSAAARVDLPISGYVVNPVKDGVAQAAISVDPDHTSVTLTGLTGGAYSFTVSVVVRGITGAPSPRSNTESPSGLLAPSTYQVDPRHDGNQTVGAIRSNASLAWTKTFENTVSYPVVGNGRVFVTVLGDGGSSIYGGRLYALDQATGAVLWGPITLGGTYGVSRIAYEDHKVYVSNYNGVLRAFDEATGASVWSRQLPGQYAFTAAPSAYRGVVYIGGAGSGGTLYAVDGATGQVLWTAAVANGDQSSPAVDADGVYVSYACAVSYRFDPATGAMAWIHTTGCSGGGGKTTVLAGNRLYVRDAGTGNAILDTATGNAVGTFAAGPTPAVAGATRFELSSGTISAVDVATGTTKWSQVGDGTLIGAPVISGNQVIVGGSSGAVVAFNAQTGAVVWSGNAGAPVLAADEQNALLLTGFAIGGGRLFQAASDRLVAFG